MAGPFCFLDRDGTINIDRHYLSDPDGVELLPGAAEGLRSLSAQGYRLVILSNQSGIGRGYFTAAAAQAVHDRLLALLAGRGVTIAGSFFCPHAPQDACDCRKPGRGLADQALATLGGTLTGALVIGDKPSDIGLAAAIGLRGILIAPGPAPACGQAATARDLGEAALLARAWRAAPVT